MDHLVIAPIIIPLLVGAVLMLIDERRRALKATLGVVSASALLALAVLLLYLTDHTATGADATVRVYRLGDWPSLFGIVLVLDRLSAMMLVLTGILGLSALVFALARWQKAGAHFHSLFQFQLMGLNGAFLTGDLFNLFVFFEIMLAASYGLALHGSGLARVRAGLHYIAINLAASLLFLIGVSMIYGVSGTLNMAELAVRIAAVAPEDRGLLEAGAAILGVAFLIKAGMWPLGFWLPNTYTTVGAPSAAIISILSKVGIYAIIRIWLLVFGDSAGTSAGFGGHWLLIGGVLTIAFGSIAVLATQNLARLAGASVLVSSGTLLAAIGAGQVAVTGGALFYMTSSVLAIAGLFLLIELVERGRMVGADVLAVTREAFGEGEDEESDDDDAIGVSIPAIMAILGIAFMACALLLAGLPPLSGFLAKFAILAPMLAQGTEGLPFTTWALMAALILSGLATVVAMSRTGIDVFWASPAGDLPRVRLVELGPVMLLLALCVALTVQAGPVMRYMEDTARSLHGPERYVQGVMTTAAPGTGKGVAP
ncbi:monovalent cation/H+ antiporter subunit D [Azospirillum brasilense]|uniref:Monovalent cation/H+ antiporter subunit D n=1 Tax=Azospirillum brasilense TaxID=192 RepID=A0A4D8QNN9_AZOBR|nr:MULTISPECIES: monovalent cation/H+ antiporter subunit D [Azospirillum]MDW7557586.1 monovalent cation/H+ antiporter subunit D [Azospirillum brasilense]MDW7595414.1 monovalent cation/H+ antiporter subunit D [Azospirillum brasilense]MDW7630109.1 monovalent cation/H+ antiporter subunit D [Azospirillum brasilense]MDX5951770.1 monovalent cation/H+ antiporter subunit D [Azospirillum brasilense]OPH12240.1 monovalent cation/H+ antiporter subunit D [Azospirillum brasilense]